jgi:hypothetical protein
LDGFSEGDGGIIGQALKTDAVGMAVQGGILGLRGFLDIKGMDLNGRYGYVLLGWSKLYIESLDSERAWEHKPSACCINHKVKFRFTRQRF